MRKFLMTLTFAIATMTFCSAQQIEIKKNFWGYKFIQNEKSLSMNGLARTMINNEEAHSLIKKAKKKIVIANITAVAGGLLIGLPIGTAARGNDADWNLALIGSGFVAVSIPLSISATRNTKKAIEIYNSSLESTAYKNFKPQFNIVSNANGVGLSMKF